MLLYLICSWAICFTICLQHVKKANWKQQEGKNNAQWLLYFPYSNRGSSNHKTYLCYKINFLLLIPIYRINDMKNRLLLLCLMFFPFYTQGQVIWKNLGQPQGLVIPCSFYTDSKKLVSCGLSLGDMRISFPYVSSDLATSWQSILTSKNDENVKYATAMSTQNERIKRDKKGF